MKAKIAVATVSGKAYYLIVNELKKSGVPFISLTPYDPIPIEIKVVITTDKEKPLIKHDKVLSLGENADLQTLINQALQYAEGKSSYEKVFIGVDPGEILGLAVLADGKVIRAENCSSIEETLEKIDELVKKLKNVKTSVIKVKVGDGIPEYKEKLIRALDKILPKDVILESVSEVGTSRHVKESKHRRGLRDIASAIRIAKRNGNEFMRGTKL
ncbi:hypothetical protein H5T51_01270 [Candidatus Bathyarchaeota archaeon]|nr:hypothetical protein [Candidatus Bathyarchaeota archaeon]